MATFKWAILLVSIPAVFSAHLSELSQHNKECEKDAECSTGLDNSFCNATKGEKKGVCHCIEKYHFKNDKCHPDRLLNEECEVTDECFTLNTHCDEKDKKCVCNEHFFEFEGKCAAGLNADCKKTEECKRENSECIKDKCQCKSKHVATPDEECLPISQHKKECKHDVQCSAGLAHTFCNSTKETATGVCDCEKEYLFQKDKCYQKKWANQNCTEEDDVCLTVNSHCNGGKCECLPKFPNLVDGVCSSSTIIRPLFSAVLLVFLALKVMF